MCGIVGLHLREAALYPHLGELLTEMLGQLADRGPDSAGMAIYGDPIWSPDGHSTVTLLNSPAAAVDLAAALTGELGVPVTGIDKAPTTIVHAPVDYESLTAATRIVAPESRLFGFGSDLTVLKGVGNPATLASTFDLPRAQGWQGI